MWVITENGFIAICEDRDDPDSLLFRTRTKEDLESIRRLKMESTVFEPWFDPEADYRWRVRLPREDAAWILARLTREINYDTLKAEVHAVGDLTGDQRMQDYYRVLLVVWQALKGLEDYELARDEEKLLAIPRKRKARALRAVR